MRTRFCHPSICSREKPSLAAGVFSTMWWISYPGLGSCASRCNWSRNFGFSWYAMMRSRACSNTQFAISRAFPNHVYELGRHTQGRSGVQISCYLSACLVALPRPRRWILRNLRQLAWIVTDEDEIVVKLVRPLAAAGISRWHTWLVGPKASLAKQVLNSRCFQKQRGGYDVLEQTRPAIYLPIWLHAGHLHNSLWTALCGALAGRGQMQVRCFKRGSGGDELR